MTRVVDTREYLDVLRGLTEEGKEVSLLISGSSMAPFLIHARDYVYFRKPDRELKKGDIVFFQRDSGPQGSDLRPDLLCQKKGQKNSARRFLVGIFRSCVDGFPPCAPGSDQVLQPFQQAAKAEKKLRTGTEKIGYSSARSVHLLHRPYENAEPACIRPIAKRFSMAGCCNSSAG